MGEAAGNGAKAAVLAGYATPSARVTASRLLRKASVRLEIANKRVELDRQVRIAAAEAEAQATAAVEQAAQERNAKIADAWERREILTRIARSERASAKDVVRAIDVMNRMDCLYIQHHQVAGEGGGPIDLRITIVKAAA